MTTAKIALDEFDPARVKIDEFKEESNGMRATIRYEYPDGKTGRLLLATNRIVFPFGMSPPQAPKDGETSWQLPLGSRQVHRDPSDYYKFVGASENETKLYTVADKIDKLCKDALKKYESGLPSQGPDVQGARFKSSVRGSNKMGSVNTKPEVFMRTKFNVHPEGAVDDKKRPLMSPSFVKLFRDRKRMQISFEEAKTQSFGAEGVVYICAASIYITKSGIASVQWRVNLIEFVKRGSDPSGDRMPNFDSSGIDYGELPSYEEDAAEEGVVTQDPARAKRARVEEEMAEAAAVDMYSRTDFMDGEASESCSESESV